MHQMDKTPRILTIIGLIFEGIGAPSTLFGAWVMMNFDSFPGISAETMDLTQQDFNEVVELFAWLGDILFVLAIVMGVVFLVNLVLFVKLLQGKYDEESAKKVYLYQAIWGGINVLFNQVTAIMYLISGVSGYSGHREERNIRDGI
ncbi:hypothetical protein [Candidatus Xianfuyuplasma coldseepsis]|uniref:DUF4064 domain-containing protein n=1 Tax=Candidatus Xianfuyuplasma coldseepsis TaxID=2782163 RepID=A0A7L7KQ59_9MOLU|nr:hypothetical protein [Xianfuyuplasma coldseepsis]QMS84853.1 hypothetical protein G4Z02_03490 [Xianfuyuplasma coldseepsis]